MNNLEEKIKEIIREFCVEYIGNMSITKDHDRGCDYGVDTYTLKLDLNQHEAPLFFSYQGTEEEFLKAFRKDFSQRQIDRARYYKGIQVDPGHNEYFIIEIPR